MGESKKPGRQPTLLSAWGVDLRSLEARYLVRLLGNVDAK